MKKFLGNYYIVISFLLAIFLASSWSLLQPNFFKVHDFTQAARVAEMTRALNDGHFPVRWTQNFGYGYGMPLFEFYAPLPYYFGAFFYWLGLDMILVLKLMFLATNLGTMLGAYLLGKKLFNKTSGLLLASALTLAPYRAVNLFVRGALSEAWGIMALPWILWAIVKVINQEKNSWLYLTASLIVLFLSHNLSVLIFALFALIFALSYWLKNYVEQPKKTVKNFKKVMFDLFKSAVVALGFSAFYLIPSFVEKDLTQVREIVLGDYFNFRLHFLYLRQFFKPNWGYRGSEWGPNDGFSFFLGYGQLAGLGLGLLAMSRTLIKKSKLKLKSWLNKNLLILVWLMLMAAALLMTTHKTLFIWEKIGLLEFVQFPWRFMIVGILFLSLITAALPKLMPKKGRVVGLSMVTLIIATNFYYFRPEKRLAEPEAMYYSAPNRIATEMSGILPDYLPKNMFREPTPILNNQITIFPDKLGIGTEQVLVNKTHQKLVKLNLQKDLLLNFGVADFPGWVVELDGERINKQTAPDGTISALIPKGEHLVGIIFKSTPVRLISDLVSLTFALFLFYNLLGLNLGFKARRVDAASSGEVNNANISTNKK